MPIDIDPDTLARQLRRQRRDEAEVARQLATIASAVAGRFAFRCRSDQDDAAAEATLHLLTNADAYTPDRGDPVAFFTTLAANRIRDLLRSDARRRRRVGEMPADSRGRF